MLQPMQFSVNDLYTALSNLGRDSYQLMEMRGALATFAFSKGIEFLYVPQKDSWFIRPSNASGYVPAEEFKHFEQAIERLFALMSEGV